MMSVGLYRWPLPLSRHLHPVPTPTLTTSQHPASPSPPPHHNCLVAGRDANGGSCQSPHRQALALWGPLRWSRPGQRPRSQLAFPTMFSSSRAHVLQTSEVSALRVSTELWSPHRASDPSTEALPTPKPPPSPPHPRLCPPEGPDLWRGRSLQPHLMVEEQRGASGRAPTCWGQGRAHAGCWDLPME